ncbi:unnamed protein product [Polarella glacialis]|uniref:Uncharacterized protein n=1 Tax=Polarella glacialis TaxID=89957 RepID=A0A813LXL0_POLGL|nr:unnamed protein product [Polarella glacialis]
MEGMEMSRRVAKDDPKAASQEDSSDDDAAQQWSDMDMLCSKKGDDRGEALKQWANLDVSALALATTKGIVVRHPVLLCICAFGLLLAAFAGGLPVDAASEEAYGVLLQQAEVIDSRELGQQALVELQKAEEGYFKVKGWFGACDDPCMVAFDKAQMARAEVARVQRHRDRVLSEGRQEVGIWSSFGVQDVRNSFWAAWKSGKEFAARCTMYDAMFMVAGGREESLQAMILRLVIQYVANLTMGLIGAFFYFVYNVYCLILSYGSSFMSGLAFLLLAAVAGLSMVATYLGSMYAVVAGGGVLLIQQAAKQAALEMDSKQKEKKKLQHTPAPRPPRQCPV